MPRRFFRKFAFKREHLRDQWWVAPFDHLLHDPNLWGIRRRTVVPAFALGLFVCYLPVPGHMLTATLLAILLRVNVPIAGRWNVVSSAIRSVLDDLTLADVLGPAVPPKPARAGAVADLFCGWFAGGAPRARCADHRGRAAGDDRGVG